MKLFFLRVVAVISYASVTLAQGMALLALVAPGRPPAGWMAASTALLVVGLLGAWFLHRNLPKRDSRSQKAPTNVDPQ